MARAAIDPILKKIGSEYKPVLSDFTEGFTVQLKLSLTLALIFTLPIFVYEIWSFVAPGLKPEEQKPFKRLAPVSVVLFLLGAFFAVMILPNALQWFAEQFAAWPGVGLYQQAGKQTNFCLLMILAFGIGFQLPLIVWALGALNLLSAATLIKYWRHSVTFIFFAAAAITPSNDPFSMMMMAVPLCILFIMSVYAVKLTQKKQKEKRDLLYGNSDLDVMEGDTKELVGNSKSDSTSADE